MALTNRERIIVIIAVLSVGILIGDRYILSPLFEKRQEVRQQRETLQSEVEQAHSVLQRQKIVRRRWAEMKESGLSYDIEKIEGLVFRYLERSSDSSRLLITSIQPERLSDEGRLGKIDFVISGTGSMESVTRFLWEIETAEIPVKIDSFQLGANDENATQMSLQLKLSSIYLKEVQSEEQEQS